MAVLKVGAAKVCIDPPKEMYPFPSNFGMCDESRNPCYVRTLAIDNGEKKILFVVYEMSDIPSAPGIMSALSEASGIPEEDIILAVTHNHTAPNDKCKFPVDEKKLEFFTKYEVTQGAAAAKKAVETMRPAKYGYGEIDSFCNMNRDMKSRFGFWVEGPNYEGYSNKTLAVIKFTDMDGKLIASMLNFGAHAVCAFVQKDVDGKVKSSSNFPGIACRFVEDYFGNDSVAIWTSGCAGNQDPILWDYQWLEYPDGYVTKIALPDGSGYTHMDILGAKQGADAVTCIESIDASAEEMSIRYLKSTVSVPARKRDPNFKMPPFGLRMGGEGPRTDWSAPKMPELPTMLIDPDKTIDYTLNFLKLGDIGVILTSGELYAEIGRDMMDAAPMEKTFVITHIPGQGGYTLDKSSKDHKTFQSFGGVEPGSADEPLTNKTRELVEEALRS
jgi:hypothetical protein